MRELRATLAVSAALLATTARASAGPNALVWADETGSPRPVAVADERESSLAALCPAADGALDEVARRLARGDLPADDMEAVAYGLRVAGEPHTWPRAWLLRGAAIEPDEASSRMKAWLATFREPGRRRCGVAWVHDASGDDAIAAVAVDAQGDLAAMPTRVRTGAWMSVEARVLVPARGARVVVLDPDGLPRGVPTSFDGRRVRARFRADRPGGWLVQVLIDGERGPRPALEAWVFAGIDPPAEQPALSAPGERAGEGVADDAEALARMLGAARAAGGLAPLARDPRLDALAREHAARMLAARRVGHDVGDGDPVQRFLDAGLSAKQTGENVAHAASAREAHRALWASPSHRANVLGPRFDRVGLGVARDPDGSVWVTETFAGAR